MRPVIAARCVEADWDLHVLQNVSTAVQVSVDGTTPSCGRGIWSIAVIDSRVSIAARDIADLDRSEVVHWLRQTNDRDVMLRFAEVPRGTCER